MAKVVKSGNGQAISFTEEEAEIVGLNVGDVVEIKPIDNGILKIINHTSSEEKWNSTNSSDDR